jgi:hypothetical protein
MIKKIALFAFIIALAACDNGGSPSRNTTGKEQEQEKENEQQQEEQREEEVNAPVFSGFILSGEPVTGVLYEEMDSQDFNAVLPRGYSFKYMKTGLSADNWVRNLPLGLTAKVKSRVNAGDTSLVITVSGRPYEERAETLVLEIPEAYITAPEKAEAAETLDAPEAPEKNAGVLFAIGPYPVSTEGISIGASPDSTEGIAIGTAEELAKIGNDAGFPLDGSYYLTADIDLGAYDPWTPIGRMNAADGKPAYPFTGTLNGNGKTIRNLKISPTGHHHTGYMAYDRVTGLFGYTVGAVIKNLTVDLGEYSMEAPGGSHYTMYLSPLVGFAHGTRIYGVTVTGTLNVNFNATYGDNRLYIGAIGGKILSGEVAGCVSSLVINGTGSGSYWAGGIVGYDVTTKYINNRAGGDITINVIHKGTYFASSDPISLYVGGFVGNTPGSAEYTSNTVTGNISIMASGTDNEVYDNAVLVEVIAGGFAGQARGSFSDCTASGNLTVEIADQRSDFIPKNRIGAYGGGFAGMGDAGTYLLANNSYTGTITFNQIISGDD